MSMENHGGMILTEKNGTTRRKPSHSATVSTTNPTWTDQGTNPGLRGERQRVTARATEQTIITLVAYNVVQILSNGGASSFNNRRT
jgi:hypothetical protein